MENVTHLTNFSSYFCERNVHSSYCSSVWTVTHFLMLVVVVGMHCADCYIRRQVFSLWSVLTAIVTYNRVIWVHIGLYCARHLRLFYLLENLCPSCRPGTKLPDQPITALNWVGDSAAKSSNHSTKTSGLTFMLLLIISRSPRLLPVGCKWRIGCFSWKHWASQCQGSVS